MPLLITSHLINPKLRENLYRGYLKKSTPFGAFPISGPVLLNYGECPIDS